jgi:hypothetical protein
MRSVRNRRIARNSAVCTRSSAACDEPVNRNAVRSSAV